MITYFILLFVFTVSVQTELNSLCFCDEGCFCTDHCINGFLISFSEMKLCPKKSVCCVNLKYPPPRYLDLDTKSALAYTKNVIMVAKDVEQEVIERARLLKQLKLVASSLSDFMISLFVSNYRSPHT